MVHAVIMAGGIGSRFWPKSRLDSPKQFLPLFGQDTLIQSTFARLSGLVDPENCHIVTHTRYADLTHKQLPAIPKENILVEPVSRNTAPCIAYAAWSLYRKDPDAVMVVLPADHAIGDVQQFHRVLNVAIQTAQQSGALVTIGIEPTYPATGYGYIQVESDGADVSSGEPAAFLAKTFAEKPNVSTAERFLDSGDFLWNSGMFIWRADSILEALKRHLSDVYEAFESLEDDHDADALEEAFLSCPAISIDYGVMERANEVYVVPGSFGWSDVGDWRAVYDLSEKGSHGNSFTGTVVAHDSSRCLVQADHKLIALVGVHDLIVVDTDDAILVCHREASQRVRNIVDYLHSNQLDDFV